MAETHHTGIPRLQWSGAYPPCTPSVVITADLNPFCAGDSVTFTPTFTCITGVTISAYAWIVNGSIVNTSVDPYTSTTLADGDRVGFLFVLSNGNTYFSNVVTMVEKTEGCEPVITPIKHGLLYNLYAFIDLRGIAKTGWERMIIALDGNDFYGISNAEHKDLKESGTTNWDSPNYLWGLSTGFDLLPTGSRDGEYGSFNRIGTHAIFWLNEDQGGAGYSFYSLINDDNYVNLNNEFDYRTAYSIILRRTSTPLIDGEYGTYTQNDGTVIKTICISGIEYTYPLIETKYNNGDTIPEVVDDAAWTALTTGALCAYDNNWINV